MKFKFENKKAIIGMIHLMPLPGSPNYSPTDYSMKMIIERATEEAKIYEEAGIDGIQIENYWDQPFIRGEEIGYETVAAMSVVANEISNKVSIPFGINLHMNGGMGALAAAVASGAKWIRVFEYISAYISYTGLTEGIGGQIARYRNMLKANNDIDFICDVGVKHGSHFLVHDRTLNELAIDAQEQGADAIIITGFSTGIAPTKEKILESKTKIHLPVFLGSGVNSKNVKELLSVCDGIIAGSHFKTDGKIENLVEYDRVYEFMKLVNEARK
ncbi:BtpA/SgcQ family protein [Tissierella creatinophila]|uniref:Putative sgc region protein SgcQ n=1 Tax=Tissierella creatinophila DSM 6911 TaxID=1123403 RepID=A0A1U7M2H7_TISCR|nr:BtpA/SgcQ family protein [Tissierella creatinophila]OLS01496.1 putative sgc region protein SgcQ [Tissierella creatinophila DSM 6911]